MGGENLRFSWQELQDAPGYVIRFCWDLLSIKRRCMAERADRAAPRPGPGGGR